MATLRILTAEGCKPCSEFKELVETGRLLVEVGVPGEEVEIEVVDVISETGFALLEGLQPSGVPAAYLDNEQCAISYEDDERGERRVVISCGEAMRPEADQS